jgi:hypothetical protein
MPEFYSPSIFDNGEEGIFDVKPYLGKGVFKELKNLQFFNSVKPFMGTIQWKNGQDFCPDTLYIESKRLPVGPT